MATHAITDVAIVLRPEDDVAIAKKEIPAGTVLEDADGRIEVRQDIKPGHKVARRTRRTGEAVRRYGQPIGFGMAFVRRICHFVDGIICYIGFLWPLWDEKKQTIADKIVSTVVVQA